MCGRVMPGVMLLMDVVEQLNSHKYLYLDKLYEEVDLELCILVDEAKVEGDEFEGEENASSCRAIISDGTCRKYKIMFEDYLAYSVRNESFTVWDNEEEFTGNVFRVYTKSKFIDYVRASTESFLVENVVGVYKHYEIVCQNQIIDVASSHEPKIEITGASSGVGAT